MLLRRIHVEFASDLGKSAEPPQALAPLGRLVQGAMGRYLNARLGRGPVLGLADEALDQ